MLKHCSKCDSDKEETDFWKAKKGKNGIDWWCKVCRKKAREESEARPVKKPLGRKPHIVPEGMRWCSGCQKGIPLEYFTREAKTCKGCRTEHHYLRAYGITRKDYENMVRSQGGVCAICKLREPIYVDHDHQTGKVRGILCPPCNTGIGYFFDDSEILDRASKYVARNE